MKIVYAISGLLVLSVAVLVLSGPGTGYATCCQQGTQICPWNFLPTATQAVSGAFDTATDGDSDELTVQWCFSFDPIGANISFNSTGSSNINAATVAYTLLSALAERPFFEFSRPSSRLSSVLRTHFGGLRAD